MHYAFPFFSTSRADGTKRLDGKRDRAIVVLLFPNVYIAFLFLEFDICIPTTLNLLFDADHLACRMDMPPNDHYFPNDFFTCKLFEVYTN